MYQGDQDPQNVQEVQATTSRKCPTFPQRIRTKDCQRSPSPNEVRVQIISNAIHNIEMVLGIQCQHCRSRRSSASTVLTLNPIQSCVMMTPVCTITSQ
jgi:hypothetical protein